VTRVVLAVLATAVLLTSCGRGGDAGASGRLAPTFDAEDVRAGRATVSLAALQGKPAVVNFFAAWCVPCRNELPLLVAAHRRLGDRVAFVGVDVKDSRTRATDLIAEFGVDYPAAYDPQGQVAAGFRVQAMPTTFFLRRDGRIVDQVLGELSRKRLDQGVQKLESSP
jgi:cytochrome c biogenesis protein CcmG/thiol:disulfide interchange protein DsbE